MSAELLGPGLSLRENRDDGWGKAGAYVLATTLAVACGGGSDGGGASSSSSSGGPGPDGGTSSDGATLPDGFAPPDAGPIVAPQPLSVNIVVDQFGYRSTAEKIAVVRSPVNGFDKGAAFTPGATYAVVDAHTGQKLLEAVSCGAVFMGAITYIGNGPNFMVKAIASHRGLHGPGFFGYMLWSLAVLGPIFLLLTLLFFRG